MSAPSVHSDGRVGRKPHKFVADSPSFELTVRRSFADYTALWLQDAALEYGCAVVLPR